MGVKRSLALGLLLSVALVLGVAPRVKAAAAVEVLDFGYSPDLVTIVVGDQIDWSATGGARHTVTAGEGDGVDRFDSGTLTAGDRFTHVFNTIGSVTYHCEIHPSMRGIVRVVPPPTTTAAPPTTAPPEASSPESAASTSPTATEPRPAPTPTTRGRTPQTAAGTVSPPSAQFDNSSPTVPTRLGAGSAAFSVPPGATLPGPPTNGNTPTTATDPSMSTTATTAFLNPVLPLPEEAVAGGPEQKGTTDPFLSRIGFALLGAGAMWILVAPWRRRSRRR